MDQRLSSAEWSRIGEIFDAALDVAGPERSAFIRDAAAGDSRIAVEVERLIAADERPSGLLDTSVPLDVMQSASLPVFTPGTVLADRFQIVRLLGKGGMGEVYEANDLHVPGSRIALKTIAARLSGDRASRERFRSEVFAARRVTHPGICRIHELHDDPSGGDLMFLTMELLEGRSLAEALVPDATRPLADPVFVFRQIAKAVAAAHKSGVIHCDIKSSNVILVDDDSGPRPVVTDFGLARAADRTAGHVAAGTPRYMAPELLAGSPPSFATDIYALGVLGLAMFGSETLEPGASPELRQAGLQGVIARCLDEDPTRRYPSAVHLAADIDRVRTRGQRLRRRAAIAALILLPVAYFAWERLHPPAAGQVSVAILPFDDHSDDHRYKFLADTMPVELTRSLGNVRSLRVIAQSSAATFRDSRLPNPEIGKRLGARFLIRGSVGNDATSIFLDVDAVSAETGATIWKDRFIQPAGSALALREQTSVALAGALPIALAPAQLVQLRGRPTTSAEAYNRYLLGLQKTAERSLGAQEAAVSLFGEATRIDPGFALAWAHLSLSAIVRSGESESGSDTWLQTAEAAASRALSIDPSLAEGHLAMGAVRQSRYFDWAGAEREFRAAIQTDPGMATAHHWLAGLLSDLRRAPEALAEIGIARSLDPVSLAINNAFGEILTRNRQSDEAIRQFELASSLGLGARNPLTGLGDAWAQKEEWDKSIAAFREALNLQPEFEEAQAGLGYSLAKAGRTAEALAVLDDLFRQNSSKISIAEVYVGLGRYDEAIAALEDAWNMRDRAIANVAADPRNDPLWRIPRFTELLKKISLL